MALFDYQRILSKVQLPPAFWAKFDALSEQIRRSLLVCLPEPLRRLAARRNRCLLVEPHEGAARLLMVTGEDREHIGEIELEGTTSVPALSHTKQDQNQNAILMMPCESILVRSVSFPAQVRSNLPQVVRYELDRLSPFQASEVLYDFAPRAATKASPRLTVDLALCRRDLIDPWVKRLRDAGRPITRISWQGAWPSANLLPPAERPKRNLALFTLNNLLILTVLFLTAAALVGPLWQKNEIAKALQVEVRRAGAEAIAVDELRQELEQARLGSTAVLQQKWDAPDLLALLRELTDRLPDNTWLQTFDYNNGQIELRGESGQATALIAILEQADGISDVSFRSPVTQDPRSGMERFNIALQFSATEEK